MAISGVFYSALTEDVLLRILGPCRDDHLVDVEVHEEGGAVHLLEPSSGIALQKGLGGKACNRIRMLFLQPGFHCFRDSLRIFVVPSRCVDFIIMLMMGVYSMISLRIRKIEERIEAGRTV